MNATQIGYPKYTMLQPSRYGWFCSMLNDLQTIAVAYQGDSLSVEADILCSMIKPGDHVIDVGASVGSLTMAFASAVGHKGKVLAIEPQPLPYQCLVANIALNSLSHIVVPLQAAAGKDEGEISVPILDPLDPNFGGCSLLEPRDGLKMPVQVLTIDSLQPPRSNLIKIDVEGMEPDVLRGAYQTISKYKPILWVEHLDYLSHRSDTKAQLLEIFAEHDYVAVKICTPTFSPANIRRQTINPFPENTGDQNVLALPGGTIPPDFTKFHCSVSDFK